MILCLLFHRKKTEIIDVGFTCNIKWGKRPFLKVNHFTGGEIADWIWIRHRQGYNTKNMHCIVMILISDYAKSYAKSLTKYNRNWAVPKKRKKQLSYGSPLKEIWKIFLKENSLRWGSVMHTGDTSATSNTTLALEGSFFSSINTVSVYSKFH